MIEIKALKLRSAAFISSPQNNLLLRAANLPIRAGEVLNAMGVIKIAGLAEVSEVILAEPKLGKTEMLAILRAPRFASAARKAATALGEAGRAGTRLASHQERNNANPTDKLA